MAAELNALRDCKRYQMPIPLKFNSYVSKAFELKNSSL